jgi:2-methylcitrate dehydratase
MSTISQTIADFVAGVTFDSLPEETVAEAKRFLYDSLGCAFGGTAARDLQIAREVFLGLGGTEEATVIGCGTRTSAPTAAFLNSLMVRALDFNDVYWKQDPSHPSDLIPAALALGERVGASGRDVVTAIILGYEFEMRLCEVAFPGIRERKWHHATFTQFASAIMASKILGLNPAQIAHAIGISGAHNYTVGAVAAGKLTMMKNAADPFAVHSGVMAALLAEKGFEGPDHILDGKEGLKDAFGGKWNLDVLVEGLGVDYRIHQCAMKAFPVEGLAHSTLSAVLNIAAEMDLWPEEVKSVDVETIARAVDILADPSKYKPTTRETADHSLPFCIASAIMDKGLTPASFVKERLGSKRLQVMMDKITITANADFEKLFPDMQPSQVTITAMDGRQKTERVDYPKGDPRSPMTQDDLDRKFQGLAGDVITDERRESIKHTIFDLDNLPKVSDLMSLCVANTKGPDQP